MIVRLNASTRETAAIWEKRIIDTGLNNRRSYTDLEKPTRYADGFLGELSFQNLLWLRGKRYAYKAKLDGHSDRSGSDVYVWHTHGERMSVNVKTAAESFHTHMMIPDKQFSRYACDIYVAAHLVGDDCHFEGWLYHREVQRVRPTDVKIKTRSIAFKDLHPMQDLLDMLMDGDLVQSTELFFKT